MVSKKLIIINQEGIHLRPANRFCTEAIKYKSSIQFQIREKTANAKSVLSVLAARVSQGDEIELFCEGEDEEEALQAMSELVENGLGE